jgi:adenosine 3'-phospho 5'-phosphosulfate transporter B3
MRPNAHLFGLTANAWPRSVQFSVAGFGIFISFYFPAVAHFELHEDFNFDEPFVFTFLQFFAVALTCIPSFVRICFSRRPLTVPVSVYLLVSAVFTAANVLDNYAAFRLSHSTELLFKSPRMIPVMLGNIVFLKHRLSFSQIVIVCVIVTGLVGFTLGDFVGFNEFDLRGVGALFLSLCLEAVAVNLEERLLVDLMVPQSEVMALVFGPGVIGAFVMMAVRGEIKSVLLKVRADRRCVGYFVGYAGLGAIGLHFVFFSITLFGSLQTVMFTSLRKIHNAMCVILLTPDLRFTNWHRVSIAILAVGIVANVIEQFGSGQDDRQNKLETDPFAFLDTEPTADDFSDRAASTCSDAVGL